MTSSPSTSSSTPGGFPWEKALSVQKPMANTTKKITAVEKAEELKKFNVLARGPTKLLYKIIEAPLFRKRTDLAFKRCVTSCPGPELPRTARPADYVYGTDSRLEDSKTNIGQLLCQDDIFRQLLTCHDKKPIPRPKLSISTHGGRSISVTDRQRLTSLANSSRSYRSEELNRVRKTHETDHFVNLSQAFNVELGITFSLFSTSGGYAR